MKTNILKENLFISTLLNENGTIIRQPRKVWLRIGEIIAVVMIFAFMWLSIIVLN